MQRVQESPFGNGEARGARRLGRDLTAVQMRQERLRRVLRSEEIPVELFELEQPEEVGDVAWPTIFW